MLLVHDRKRKVMKCDVLLKQSVRPEQKVEVTELRDDTFFAALHMTVQGKPVVLDSRPSDAIALALRTGARIFVALEVLEASQERSEPKPGERSTGERPTKSNAAMSDAPPPERPRVADLLAANPPAKWAEILENLSPEDFGKFKM